MRPAPTLPTRSVLLAAALTGGLSLAATLSGCGGDLYSDGAADPASPAAREVSDPAAAGAPSGGAPGDTDPAAAAGPTLSVTAVDDLGDVAVDAAGFTVYRFDSDTADPPTSACAGDCAEVWPPVTVGAAADLGAEGVDPALLGTLTRDDGSLQVTLAGWPLYRYAQDAVPGDALGHGVGGTWFAATPTGGRASADPSGEPAGGSTGETAADSSDDTGYDY